jgi:hypothetical protein
MACQRVGRPALARQVLPLGMALFRRVLVPAVLPQELRLQCHRRVPHLGAAAHLQPVRPVLVVHRVVLAASATWHATVAALR